MLHMFKFRRQIFEATCGHFSFGAFYETFRLATKTQGIVTKVEENAKSQVVTVFSIGGDVGRPLSVTLFPRNRIHFIGSSPPNPVLPPHSLHGASEVLIIVKREHIGNTRYCPLCCQTPDHLLKVIAFIRKGNGELSATKYMMTQHSKIGGLIDV